MDDLVQIAKEIIEKIIYITVATVDKEGNPWNSPIFAAFDKQYNFYWRSAKTATHSQNIKTNNRVFIAIYDSTAPWSTGEGVYIQAHVEELHKEKEINQALLLLDKRAGKSLGKADKFMDEFPRRVYKAVPEKVWINVDGDINGNFVDKRVEIKLR